MKRVVISILLATLFATIPVFAGSREARSNGFGTEVISTNPAEAPSPQFRRRHRRRRYVFIRRHRGRRHIHVMRRRGRRR